MNSLVNRQLHVVSNADPASGGEALAALEYSRALSMVGAYVFLLSNKHQPLSVTSSGNNTNLELIQLPYSKILLINFLYSYSFISSLCKKQNIRIIHIHGAWSPILLISAVVGFFSGLKIVISPHGSMEPWALNHKKFKKFIALKTYQGWMLNVASLFVATSDQEFDSIRAIGLQQPVAVLPNGVDLNLIHKIQSESASVRRTILFLSRIHPKKGLMDLVHAWSLVRDPGWRIIIAGGDEGGYRARVQSLISEKELNSDIQFVGYVEGSQKQVLYSNADIFILPTYSENFGIAIAEALAYELPVITTKSAPWSDLLDHRCGWWVEPGVDGISSALIQAMACSPIELKEMGRRGRELIIKKFSWEVIGSMAYELTNWILDDSIPMPSTLKNS